MAHSSASAGRGTAGGDIVFAAGKDNRFGPMAVPPDPRERKKPIAGDSSASAALSAALAASIASSAEGAGSIGQSAPASTGAAASSARSSRTRNLLNSYGPLVDSATAEPTGALWIKGGGYSFMTPDGETKRLEAPDEIAGMYSWPGHLDLVNMAAPT